MKNINNPENPFYALVALCIIFILCSIKPMFLYATDKQAYYQYELNGFIENERFADQRFKDNQLTVYQYLSSMMHTYKRQLEIIGKMKELNNNKNT